MPRTKLDHLKRKPVEIRANGLTYRGVLIEATEDEITLKRTTGFITIPMDRITGVVDPNEVKAKSGRTFVDSSFYNADQPIEEGKDPKKN